MKRGGIAIVAAAALVAGLVLLLRDDPSPSARTLRSPAAPPPPARPHATVDERVDPTPTPGQGPGPADAPPHANGGRILGSVSYTGPGDKPAADVIVVLTRGSGSGRDEVVRSVADAAGKFVFDGVAAGEYTFATRTPEGDPWFFKHDGVTVIDGKESSVALRVDGPDPSRPGISVKGTVVYDDGRPAAEFRFEFVQGHEQFAVSGRAGAFERRFPRPGVYEVRRVEADGHAWFPLGLEFRVRDGATAEIRLPSPRAVTLLVVDAESGTPLPSARAFRFEWEEGSIAFFSHPNPATLAGTPLPADAQGRIALGVMTSAATFWVRADGRAWRRVRAEPIGDGETRVPLVPGGSVRVEVAGWSAIEDAHVHARGSDPSGDWALPDPGPDGTALYEGLPEGPWRFTVRRGRETVPSGNDSGEIYGEGETRIEAGSEARLRIDTTPSAAGARVPLAGTVTIPVGWGISRVRMELAGADPANAGVRRAARLEFPREGAPAPFRFEPAPPGRYEVLCGSQLRAMVELPAGGGALDIRMPSPGRARIEVVNDATGAAVDTARVTWTTEDGRDVHAIETATPGETPGTHHILAPAGPISVWVSAPGFASATLGGTGARVRSASATSFVEVAEGQETKVTVRLRGAGSVRLRFRWDGEPPDWERVGVTVWRGSPRTGSTGVSLRVKEGVGTLADIEPGSWRVSVKEVPAAFEAVPDIPFEVVAGETAEVEIPLFRKP